MLKLFQQERAGAVVIAVIGKLDAVTVFELRPAIDKLLAEGHHRIVIDVSELLLIDSSGVGAIVAIYKRAKSAGGGAALFGLSRQPEQVFRVLGLDKVLPMFATVDDAIASLG